MAADIALTFTYTNHRGKTSVRRVLPGRLYYGTTAYYKKPQWLLEAWDLDRNAQRTFAWVRITNS